MSESWHCAQAPNGMNPIVVCERESLLAEIERLQGEVARLRVEQIGEPQFISVGGLKVVRAYTLRVDVGLFHSDAMYHAIVHRLVDLLSSARKSDRLSAVLAGGGDDE